MECRFHDVYGSSHGRSKLPPEANLELHEWAAILTSRLLEEPGGQELVLGIRHATNVVGYAAGVVESPHIAVKINPWERDKAVLLMETIVKHVAGNV